MKRISNLLSPVLLILAFACTDDKDSKQESLELTANVHPVTVFQQSDGAINITVTGGTKPYQYNWSNGSTDEDITNLVEGSYSVEVTDSKNKVITETFEVDKIEPLFTETGTVTDIDGNVYKTVKIGNQWWMAENLRVKHNPSGDPITSYSVNGNESLDESVGRLYAYSFAMDGNTQEGSQGIAPDGWHIPTDSEWNELYDFLGGINVAGEKLKQYGTEIWDSPNLATNESGFTALPGGGYYINDGFGEGYPWAVHYWSSTLVSGKQRLHSIMNTGKDAYVIDNETRFSVAASVRCIKNN